MKQLVKIGITLALIASLAATALAVVNAITSPRIAAYEKSLVEQALHDVSAGYTVGQAQGQSADEMVEAVYELLDEQGDLVGYIVQIRTNGYGGLMTIMASYTLAGEVLDARLLSNAETPGLGKKAEDPTYMEKFIGTGAEKAIPQKKNELKKEDAQSVSGASVTFSAIAQALAYGSDYVKKQGEKK